VSEETTRVFITGGTGYIGRRLIPVQRQGCAVRARVRPGSERRLPPGARSSSAIRWSGAPSSTRSSRTRRSCSHLAQSGLTCSVIRPWYVLGPGHRWPIVLTPFYWIAERRASSRAAALRLGLLTIDQMVATLALVVAAPPRTSRILTVPDIRRASL
jgi:nucleoside-diphosphate-sugar epimerase